MRIECTFGFMDLAEWMKAKGLKDAQLAEQIGTLSRSQVSRLRRRRSRPQLETAKTLEEITGIPAGDLMTVEIAA